MDAFLQDWQDYHLPYLFPPFSVIGKCLAKIEDNKVDTFLLVVPCWPTQPWFTQVMRIAIKRPVLLPFKDIVHQPSPLFQTKPLKGLQLMGVLCSGNPCSVEEFQQTLPTSSWQDRVQQPESSTTALWRNGGYFVVRGRSMFFDLL